VSYGDWSPKGKGTVELGRVNTEIFRRMLPMVPTVAELFNRATFRSTQLALLTIVEAIENPGKAIPVVDHHGTRMANDHLMRMVMRIANALEFGKDWEFNAAKLTVTNRAVEIIRG